MRRRDFLVKSGIAFAAPIATSKAFGLDLDPAAELRKPDTPDSPSHKNGLAFTHPGIYQTQNDLDFMKRKVLAKEQPWIAAWERLLADPVSSLSFSPQPVAHIARGSYGRGAIGDRELRASVDAAESHMLQWIVTGDHAHAAKAADILDAWSETLWDFDGNDAMLLAGWTGASLCNVAEILRSTYPSWSPDQHFRGLMTGVYLPLLRGFFPTANGNWDGAIMQTLAAIAIFCGNRALFDVVTQHFLYGVANAGITKYVYPTGQCEESDRDQGHTQLGLGYFSLTALVAWNQHVDLFAAADNRLALGFEYTSKYMLGGEVPYFGDISPRGRGRFSDFYEAAYEHYRFVKGIDMPFTERAAQRAREQARSTLTLFRGQAASTARTLLPAPVVETGPPHAGAQQDNLPPAPPDAVVVSAGSSIQKALDALAAKGGGTLLLDQGFHSTPAALGIPSNVTIIGRGRSTLLSLDPDAAGYCIVQGTPTLQNVVLRNFILEGAVSHTPPTDPNQDKRQRSTYLTKARGGIRFQADRAGQFSNIRMERLTVRNCTMAGVEIAGAKGVSVQNCDFSDNGGKVAPGPGQHHNLQMKHVSEVEVRASRLDGSIAGCGLHVRSGLNLSIAATEAARNAQSGMSFVDCEAVSIEECLIEGNDGRGIDLEAQDNRRTAAKQRENTIQLNGSDLLRQCRAVSQST